MGSLLHATGPGNLDTRDAELYRIGYESGLAGDPHYGWTSPATWFLGYQDGERDRLVAEDCGNDEPIAAVDRAWWADQQADAAGVTDTEDDQSSLVHLTVSALDWLLDSIPDREWDRIAEERQTEWPA